MEISGGAMVIKTGGHQKKDARGEYFVVRVKDYVGVKIEKDTITFSVGRHDAPMRRDDDEFLALVLAHFIEVAERKFPHRRDDLIKVVNEVKEVTASDRYPKTQKGISDFLMCVNN